MYNLKFDKGPAQLPLNVALDLLTRPLRLLLENARNDWGFLNKIVPENWRSRWMRAIEQRWVEEENGGGLPEICQIIQHRLAVDDARRLRTWVLFDSDGRRAGDVSSQAIETQMACEQWGIAYHRLERRAIENYLPKNTLYDWAQRRRKVDQGQMRSRVGAYCALTEEQRHYYNLKEGFRGDEVSNAGISEIYDDPKVDRRGPLWHGFGKTIAQDIWGMNPYDGPTHKVYEVKEQSLEEDGFGPERSRIFQSIFQRL